MQLPVHAFRRAEDTHHPEHVAAAPRCCSWKYSEPASPLAVCLLAAAGRSLLPKAGHPSHGKRSGPESLLQSLPQPHE
jgi:hypothetical protein